MPAIKPLVNITGQTQRLPDSDFLNLGKLNIGVAVLVTAATSVTVSTSSILLQHVGIGTQNVDTILGGDPGDILIIRRTNDNNVRVRKGNGNIRGGPNRLLDNRFDTLTLMKLSGNNWVEVSWQG